MAQDCAIRSPRNLTYVSQQRKRKAEFDGAVYFSCHVARMCRSGDMYGEDGGVGLVFGVGLGWDHYVV